MPFVIGLVLAVGAAVLAKYANFDRRTFYATVLIVVGHYYVLFAAMSGSGHTVLVESVIMMAFIIAAVGGFKSSEWIVVAGLAGHGMLDAVHGRVIANAGVPVWWPGFCLAFDVGAAGIVAWLIVGRGRTSRAERQV
jgi:hypothetical protein